MLEAYETERKELDVQLEELKKRRQSLNRARRRYERKLEYYHRRNVVRAMSVIRGYSRRKVDALHLEISQLDAEIAKIDADIKRVNGVRNDVIAKIIKIGHSQALRTAS